MAKLTLTDFASFVNDVSAVTTANNNNTAIETALENTLSRDGTLPNTMSADFDMNTHYILNLKPGTTAGHALEYSQFQTFVDTIAANAAAAAASAVAAASSASAASVSASNAAGSASAAVATLASVTAIYNSFNNSYLGAAASNPLVDNLGNALTTGDSYFNTVSNVMRIWTGSIWQDFAATAPSALETFTNKTINLTSNTLTGTTAQFNTALSDNDFATLAGTETLTNKTFTTPKMTTILVNSGANTLTLPLGTDTLVGKATTDTLTNKTLTTPIINLATLTVADASFAIVDDGDNTKVAKFQLSGLTTGTTRTYTLPDVTDTVVLLGATQTLTGKTLTSPTINSATLSSPTMTTPTLGVASATTINKVTITAPATGATLTIPDGVTLTGPASSGTAMTLGNAETVTGAKTFGSAGAVSKLKIAGTTSGSTILDATAVASGTLTLPAATDTLVGLATTDTLTNKTLTGGLVTAAPSAALGIANKQYVDNRTTYSMFDFIPSTEWATIRTYSNTTDLLTYFNTAISTVGALGGGRIHIPAGRYQVSGVIDIGSNNGINFVGEGQGSGDNQGTTIECTHATVGDIWKFTGCQHSSISSMRLSCKNIVTSGAAVNVASGCFNVEVRNLRIDYCFNGITVLRATETVVENIMIRQLLGTRGVLFGGDTVGSCFGGTFIRIIADNPYPTTVGTRKTWAISTAFSLGDIILQNSKIWQCTTAGTSSGVAGGPSAIPGTGQASCFSTQVTDGTAKWQFVCSLLNWFTQDSYGNSSRLISCGFINGYQGIAMIDTQNTGSSYPSYLEAFDVELDHNHTTNVVVNAGQSFFATTCWFGSCLIGNGVVFGSAFIGEAFIGGGTRIAAAWQNGVLINAGVDITIDGCIIGGNSFAGSATNHGVAVGANIQRFGITNNRIGNLVNLGAGLQGWGVIVNTGTSDHYVISGNRVSGNVSGGVVDAGSGANKFVGNNPV